MLFPRPLIRGRLLRRYKRFLADIVLEDGTEVIAHCANPGAMLGVAPPDAEVWLLPAVGAGRKLAWSWELVRIEDALVGISTASPNALVAEALANDVIPALAGYTSFRREVPYGINSRIDFLLEAPDRASCYLEVKNVHLCREPGLAEFPDCVTLRGAKHLVELGAMAAAGYRAVMLYVVQRTDCDRFGLAADLDPGYAAAFALARAGGVEALAYACDIETDGISITRQIALV